MLVYQRDLIKANIYTKDENLEEPQSYTIGLVKDLADKWNRWEIQVKWSRGSDGFYNVYLNGNQVVDYDGITYGLCRSGRFDFAMLKYGMYSGYNGISDWYGKTEKKDFYEDPSLLSGTRISYYDNVSIAKSRSELFTIND